MPGATEVKQPVHRLDPLQLNLPERAGCLQPSEALLNQASPTQADGIAGPASRPAVQIALAPCIVPGHVRRHHGRSDQPVAVLHQGVAQIAQLQLFGGALPLQPCVAVGPRCMRLIRALLAMKILAIAVFGAILRPEALLRSPSLNQRAVHGEVLVAHEPLCLPVHFREEPLHPLRVQQTVAVFGKHRMVPHRVIHPQAHIPLGH